jgi:prevent-host-death family protein
MLTPLRGRVKRRDFAVPPGEAAASASGENDLFSAKMTRLEPHMPSYSIAKAKEQLSRLIDESLRGEIVTITRHGKPVVELRPSANASDRMTAEEMAQLRARRAARPPLGEDAVAIIREMRDRER